MPARARKCARRDHGICKCSEFFGHSLFCGQRGTKSLQRFVFLGGLSVLMQIMHVMHKNVQISPKRSASLFRFFGEASCNQIPVSDSLATGCEWKVSVRGASQREVRFPEVIKANEQ